MGGIDVKVGDLSYSPRKPWVKLFRFQDPFTKNWKERRIWGPHQTIVVHGVDKVYFGTLRILLYVLQGVLG